MSLKKKKDEVASFFYNGKHLTAKEYLAEKKRINNERRKDAKTEDPFKEHFKYNQAVIKQHEYKVEMGKKMQAQNIPNRRITDFIKKKPTKQGDEQ